MKFISIHADDLKVEPTKKAITDADPPKSINEKECLTVFVSVEKRDEKNPESSAKKLAEEIGRIAKEVKAEKVVIYPYAHLSNSLASPKVAKRILISAESELSKNFEVDKAPFGWYKRFTITCKGHPLSELSREFGPGQERKEEKGETEALKKEKILKSEWNILTPEGQLFKLKVENGQIKGYDFSEDDGNLIKLVKYEIAKDRTVGSEPSHARIMRKLEMVDYEEGSDPGNLRYYPKGRFVKGALEQLVSEKMSEYGAMEVETPIMYDFHHPSLHTYVNRFPARQYKITTPNKEVFLRFAACFGQFLMMKDATISYRSLPLALFELTRYSFRVEQRGELAGLRRLRAFTMPDCHALCKDFNQAKNEIRKRFEKSIEIQKMIGFDIPEDFELAIRTTKEFLEKHGKFIKDLIKLWGKPALLEVWDKQFFYFTFKYELNFIDASGKAAALTTDQIDTENAKNYGITYVSEENKPREPLILHLSPSGAIERVMYALLEKAEMESRKGNKPTLPIWLNPTQARFIPVSNEKHLNKAINLAKKCNEKTIRADVDDRAISLGKKIADAEKEWISYVIVVGDRESEEKLPVRTRTGDIINLSLSELIDEIHSKTEGRPFRKLPLPILLSKRVKFVG